MSFSFFRFFRFNVEQPFNVKPRLINACGSLNCSFIMTYVMLTTFTLGIIFSFSKIKTLAFLPMLKFATASCTPNSNCINDIYLLFGNRSHIVALKLSF